jgi:hypothetical protein
MNDKVTELSEYVQAYRDYQLLKAARAAVAEKMCAVAHMISSLGISDAEAIVDGPPWSVGVGEDPTPIILEWAAARVKLEELHSSVGRPAETHAATYDRALVATA